MGKMSGMGNAFNGLRDASRPFESIDSTGIREMFALPPDYLADIAVAAASEQNRDLTIFIAGMLASRLSEAPVPAPERPRRREGATEHPSHWWTYQAYEYSLARAVAAAVSLEPVTIPEA